MLAPHEHRTEILIKIGRYSDDSLNITNILPFFFFTTKKKKS